MIARRRREQEAALRGEIIGAAEAVFGRRGLERATRGVDARAVKDIFEASLFLELYIDRMSEDDGVSAEEPRPGSAPSQPGVGLVYGAGHSLHE